MIDDILNNESTHLVAEFKDYLIMGDITEFLQKSYSMKEVKKYLPKIYDYYNSCSVIFPNYVVLHESKYIYKSIRKKQKVIDNQQEQEDKKEKLKKGDIKIEDNEEFFGSKTFYSILDQTNTSNVKLIFGIIFGLFCFCLSSIIFLSFSILRSSFISSSFLFSFSNCFK